MTARMFFFYIRSDKKMGWLRANHEDFTSKPKTLSADGKWYVTYGGPSRKTPSQQRKKAKPRPRQPSPPRQQPTVRKLPKYPKSSESEEESPPPPKRKKLPLKRQPSLKKVPTPPPSRAPSRQPSFSLMPWIHDATGLPELSQQPPPPELSQQPPRAYPAPLRRQVNKK